MLAPVEHTTTDWILLPKGTSRSGEPEKEMVLCNDTKFRSGFPCHHLDFGKLVGSPASTSFMLVMGPHLLAGNLCEH